MCRILMALLMLSMAGTAIAAVSTTNVGSLGPKITVTPPAFNPGLRILGDTIADPFIATGLGVYTGTTVGFNHDYDEMCPYGGSMSPDVVYAYTATANGAIAADLCLSSYDTAIFVYDNVWTPGNPYACNDDYWFTAPCYMYSSYVTFNILAGHTYYIVIDGYGSQSGAYNLNLTDCPPEVFGACCAASGACTITPQVMCVAPSVWHGEETACVPNPCPTPPPIPCPTGALIEGEPTCQDNYVDHYNGGCNSTPVIWQALAPQAGGCAVMCGESCTYLNQGASTRDTDWYLSVGAGWSITYTLTADFPFMMALFTGVDCAGLVYSYNIGNPYESWTLTAYVASGVEVGFFAANSGFSGYPVPGTYVMNVCGWPPPPPQPGACCNAAGMCIMATPELCAFTQGTFIGGSCVPNPCPTPTEVMSWGAVKNLYR